MTDILQRLQRYDRRRFAIAVFLLSLLGPIIAGQLPVSEGVDPSHASRLSKVGFGFVAIFFAPVIETLLFQALPAMVGRRFALSNAFLFGIVVVPFSLLHLIPAALLPSSINGFVGGLSLGLCYIVCMSRSHFHAFSVTAAVHALHNATVFFLLA